MKLKNYTYKRKILLYTLVKMKNGKYAIVRGNDGGTMSLNSDDQLNYYVKYIDIDETLSDKEICKCVEYKVRRIQIDENGNEVFNTDGGWYDYMCHYTDIDYTTNIRYIETYIRYHFRKAKRLDNEWIIDARDKVKVYYLGEQEIAEKALLRNKHSDLKRMTYDFATDKLIKSEIAVIESGSVKYYG